MKDRWVVQGTARRICAAYESTLSTADAVPLPHAGKAYMEAASPPFFLGRCPEMAFKSPVTSAIRGEWIVSHMWHEILRLSPHLFWLGFFSHRAFSSAQDDDTGERVVSRGGGFAAFFYGRYQKVVFKARVTSHNNDTIRPKRRLACPLRRLPVRPNGPRQRRCIELCLKEAQLYAAI